MSAPKPAPALSPLPLLRGKIARYLMGVSKNAPTAPNF